MNFSHLLRQRRRNPVQRERRWTTDRADVRRLLRWSWTGGDRLPQRAFYSDPRIAVYIGMGLGQMPATCGGKAGGPSTAGAIRQLRCHDPDFSVQGNGQWVAVGRIYAEPSIAPSLPCGEGHYTYPGTTIKFCANVGRRNV